MKSFQSLMLTIIGVAGVTAECLHAQTSPPATRPVQTIAVPATIEAFWSADLCAKTSGYVSAVNADIGDAVKKGQVLAEISEPELDKNLIQAKAMLMARKKMLAAAEAAVAQAQQARQVAQSQLAAYDAESHLQQVTLKRQEELSASHAATPQQLDEIRSKAEVANANLGIGKAKVSSADADVLAAEANRDVAAAQVEVADAQVQEAEVLLAYTKIVAPFDGIITERQVNPGDLVQTAAGAKGAALFKVQQLDTIRIFCDVPELNAAGIAPGATAEVKIYGVSSRAIEAKVTRIATALNPTTRTMRAEIDLKNADQALRPGMYAQVTLTLQAPARIAEATK
jgi:multidrug efflux pump subunit AcrA (membrane-fusion protein)